MPEKLFSTVELAQLWNVSESTVKRWADSGDLRCIKTPGGHRRFTLEAITAFQRSQGFDAVGRLIPSGDEEPVSGEGPDLERALERRDFGALVDLFFAHALDGDEEALGNVMARAYLRGISPIDTFDRILAPALHRVGDLWRAGSLSVADEHLATRTTLDAITRLQPGLLRRPPNGRTALLGCPEGELHDLAIRCLAYLLELEGWRTVVLGANVPFFSFQEAVERHTPDLVCLSSTHLVDLDRLSREYEAFHAAARRVGAHVAVGGLAFEDPAVQARFPHDYFAVNLRKAVQYAQKVV